MPAMASERRNTRITMQSGSKKVRAASSYELSWNPMQKSLLSAIFASRFFIFGFFDAIWLGIWVDLGIGIIHVPILRCMTTHGLASEGFVILYSDDWPIKYGIEFICFYVFR